MAPPKVRKSESFGAVKESAVRLLGPVKYRTTNLHIENQILTAGSQIASYLRKIPVKRDTIMVFADDAPYLNWAHSCRFLMFDAKTNELYDEVAAEFPPYMTEIPKTYEVFHRPVTMRPSDVLWPLRPVMVCPFRFPVGQRYAVLFSGASNNRHTNDLEFLYRTLRDKYNFKDENIYCLNYDGTINYSGDPKPVGNWPGDHTAYRMPVKGKGTKADLEAVLNSLKTKLKADDLLFIHTNNHGGLDSAKNDSYLVTYSGPAYYAADFANKLAELPKFNWLIVMMEQCHSGGFNDPIIANSPATRTSVASACVKANNSAGDAEFDPFAHDWISAITLHNMYGAALVSNPDTDSDGRIEAKEAFDYADSVHVAYDTPVYSQSSVDAASCYLGQRYLWWWPRCPILVKLFEPYYSRLPIPEFYKRVYTKIAPQLEEIEQKLEKDMDVSARELEPKIRKAIEDAFR